MTAEAKKHHRLFLGAIEDRCESKFHKRVEPGGIRLQDLYVSQYPLFKADMSLPPWLLFWGKARPTEGSKEKWHPIAYHLLDVAAVADTLLDVQPRTLAQIACSLGLDPGEARTLVVALASLHDIGKFAPVFQAKVSEYWPTSVLGPFQIPSGNSRHTEDGFVLWDEELSDHVGDRIWGNSGEVLYILGAAVFGHHGRPVSSRAGSSAGSRFRSGSKQAAIECANAVLALTSPHGVTAPGPAENGVRLASWLLSGLLTTADWVGSRQEWFPYVEPRTDGPTLAEYWKYALGRAESAVQNAGLIPCKANVLRSFSEVSGISEPPTPLQKWAAEMLLPEGPTLVIIEDVTGAGKTEAAQMLIHRLMAAGRATGAYWGMPTMATANAMYARQAKTISALYDPHPADNRKPSLILSHGQQSLHIGFRSTVLGGIDGRKTWNDQKGDPDSAIACSAFLADDRRAALLADVGAGSIDQAILGVLPTRFNTIRLFGLSSKVLVIDEAHAYDSYVNTEIDRLLCFQAALGGSAIVLSATLPDKQRTRFFRAWKDGLSARPVSSASSGLLSSDYPLATVVSAESMTETRLEAALWSSRDLPVRLVHTVEEAIDHVIHASRQGGAVAWVRNTVDDCLRAAEQLRANGIDPLVFHARFAQGDRQGRETDIMSLFGKNAAENTRAGKVVIATQVIEQSLDIDFDAMVTDIAPIDLIIQRAGRLWRHSVRTPGDRHGLKMELVVLAPEPLASPPEDWLSGTFAGTARVYEDAGVLWRSVMSLYQAKKIDTPFGLRELIQKVYDDTGDVPEALQLATNRAAGKAGASAGAAKYIVLNVNDGYHADGHGWVDDVRAPTRLGDERTVVRLARIGVNGLLSPWFGSAEPSWKAWSLSEVSVRAHHIPVGSMPASVPERTVNHLKQSWGRWEQGIVVLPLERSRGDHWSGNLRTPNGKERSFSYSTAFGLAFS
ncbi:MAG: CRISPR-associated helicase Cas3' [Gemmatimonadota bacterium]|nr:CRISPR-associated helicase Cas3' [Gemmatimonadota bacterium]